MKIIRMRYAFIPENRARRIIRKIEDELDTTLSFVQKKSLFTYITRQFYLDRGRGMKITFLNEEHERAIKAWDIIIAKYLTKIMSFGPFSCDLCGVEIRERGKMYEHDHQCPLYGYRIDFVNDIL